MLRVKVWLKGNVCTHNVIGLLSVTASFRFCSFNELLSESTVIFSFDFASASLFSFRLYWNNNATPIIITKNPSMIVNPFTTEVTLNPLNSTAEVAMVADEKNT